MSGAEALILVVEDEPQMRLFLRASLTAHGYHLLETASAREAETLAVTQHPEVVVLDLGLPDGDGIELTRRLRYWTTVPIVVVSARGREEDKVMALDAGADDYLTKPFGVNELLARLRVALRHARSGGGATSPVITVGGLRVDLERREVSVDGREVKLTPIEFRMLALLARNAGKVLTHRQILNQVWGPTHSAQTHHVRVHMADLRKRIEADPARPRFLLTEMGVGYRLADSVEEAP